MRDVEVEIVLDGEAVEEVFEGGDDVEVGGGLRGGGEEGVEEGRGGRGKRGTHKADVEGDGEGGEEGLG